jgi:hypothetical protein
MSYNTIDALPPPSNSRRHTLTRHASSAAARPQTPAVTFAAITKTISNYFFKPEKLPLAFEVKAEPKTASKPFFSKNRRLVELKAKKEDPLPNGFKNMLRAKSTVIKQKKLQEFYINREGREAEAERLQYC